MRTVKFNRLVVAELSVNLLESPPAVKVKAAFISTVTGATHGYTTCTNWSAATLAKLKELTTVMEEDIEKFHFTDTGITTSSSGSKMGAEPQGLGEHLGAGKEDVPQG